MAGRHGAESPTEMTALPVMKIQQPGNPQNPVFNIEQPQPVMQPQMTVHELRDAERFRRMRARAAPATSDADVGAAPAELHNMAHEAAKAEPEGGYVDSGDDASVSTSSDVR